MGHPTPSDRDDATFECVDCGHRVEAADERPSSCPECGGNLQNVSVPRDS